MWSFFKKYIRWYIRTLLQDSLGSHISVTCCSVSGSLYLSKLDESKKPQPKCILANDNWYSPPEFESLAGKKARKWKQSLHHLGKPLSDYVLSCTPASRGQQDTSSCTQAVVDDTRVLGPVSGLVSATLAFVASS